MILRSQANLVAARGAALGRGGARDSRGIILDRIAAQARARAFREVRTRFAGCDDALLDGGARALRRRDAVRRADLVRHADAALPAGARCTRSPRSCATTAPRPSSVADLDYVFSRDNPLYAKLEAALG